jgi:uncharacterized membrane protein
VTDFLKAAGQLHPAVIHLPIAMLLVAALAEVLRWWKPGPFLENVAAFNLHIGALTAVPAAAMGWWLAAAEGVGPELATTLLWHRWLGISVAVLSVALVGVWHRNRIHPGTALLRLYRAGLILGAGLVSITGHLGGTLVYGLDWYK